MNISQTTKLGADDKAKKKHLLSNMAVKLIKINTIIT